MQSNRSWCTTIFLTSILFSFSFKCLAQGREELRRLTIQYQQAEKADNDSLRVLAMAALATHHMVNDPELALEYSKKQFRLAEKIDLKWGLANAYNVQGGVYDYKGDYKRALERYSNAIIAYTALGRKLDLVDIYNSIGIVYSKQGINSEALTNMLKGLQLAISEKYDLGIISSYNNIGIVYESQQQYDEALKYYLKCLRVQRKLGKGYYKHATLSNIGNLYLIKKQPSLALKYYTEGVEDAILEADDPSLANNYSGIGDVYTYTKQWDKALDNHKKAFDIRNNMNDIFGLKASYLSLGE
ncbi:MAG: tetratricopeptide repeat protein, partial [Flavobacterium sp.]